MSDAVRRTIRTFVQSFVGTFLSMWGAAYVTPGVLPAQDVFGRIVTAALIAGIIAVLTLVQNLAEDNTAFPAILKAPASPGVNPTPEPTRLLEHHTPPKV